MTFEANSNSAAKNERYIAAPLLDDSVLSSSSRIVEISPWNIDVSPLNSRSSRGYVEKEDADLLASLRQHGQMVPVIVRPSPRKRRFFELLAGTRRHACMMELAKGEKVIEMLAEVRDLDDRSAWLLAETENSSRRDVGSLRKANNWRFACDTFFDGNQSALAKALGVDKSVASRTLQLSRLPYPLLGILKNPDNAPVHYAEQLAPHLNDAERMENIVNHATNMMSQGLRLSPSEAIRRLTLPPEVADEYRGRQLGIDSHPNLATVRRNDRGGLALSLKATSANLPAKDRRQLRKQIVASLDDYLDLLP